MVAVEDLEPGDRVFVRQGERISIDGVLDEGQCTVDEAVVTGELLPVLKRTGNGGGSIVTDNAAIFTVGDHATSSIDRRITFLTGDDRKPPISLATTCTSTTCLQEFRPPARRKQFVGYNPMGQVTMVGDGTNDASALAQADLGISLGSGTALASDAADITIVDDNLASVETTFDLASAARRRAIQNTGLALLYDGITIPLAGVGLLNPLFVMAAVITSGSLIAANSFRELLNE